jgi:cytochrome c peroxidase
MRRTRSVWPLIGLCALLLPACVRSTPQPQDQADPAPPSGLEYVPPAPGSYELPTIQAAADGVVIDADGTERRIFDYMGDRYVLLSFIYTRCRMPKGCPLATATLEQIEAGLAAEPSLAGRTRLISLSFDPERDTPDAMLRYAARDYESTEWRERPWSFLTTGSWKELQPILDGYGQYVVREIDEEGKLTGDFSHLLKVFLVDRQRRVRNIYSSDYIHPVLAINDLKTLMMQDLEPS